MISKIYKIQGTNKTKAKTNGNNIVQQYDINWSKRILGKLALAQIKTNIMIKVFNPIIKLYNTPSTLGSVKKLFVSNPLWL